MIASSLQRTGRERQGGPTPHALFSGIEGIRAYFEIENFDMRLRKIQLFNSVSGEIASRCSRKMVLVNF
jgi:hypothetical protein